LKNIEAYTFSNCVNLEDIKIPKTVEYIGEGAFANCKSLADISIPESIINIYNNTFKNCESLKYIALPKKLEYIGKDSFRGCILLNNVIVPKNVKQIDDGAFNLCINLEYIMFEGNLLYIGDSFYNTKFYNNIKEDEYGCKYIVNHFIELADKKREEVVIKDGTVSIANKAFSKSDISKVVFPKELRIIGESAFGHCYNLKNIEFPEGLLYIDTLCLTDCKNLNRVLAISRER